LRFLNTLSQATHSNRHVSSVGASLVLAQRPPNHFLLDFLKKQNEDKVKKAPGDVKDNATPSWSTAAIDDAADTSPVELAALSDQVDQCKVLHQRVVAVHCLADALKRFMTAHFVTTLVLVSLLVGLAYVTLEFAR
jgi:hypothetical protein